MSGKGSKPRPFSVSQDTFGENWDNIFKKKQPDHDKHMAATDWSQMLGELPEDYNKTKKKLKKTTRVI